MKVLLGRIRSIGIGMFFLCYPFLSLGSTDSKGWVLQAAETQFPSLMQSVLLSAKGTFHKKKLKKSESFQKEMVLSPLGSFPMWVVLSESVQKKWTLLGKVVSWTKKGVQLEVVLLDFSKKSSQIVSDTKLHKLAFGSSQNIFLENDTGKLGLKLSLKALQ